VTSPKIRVLLVEDDVRLATLTQTYLEERGLEVLRAPDGEAALDLLRATTVTAVVLDLMLPGIDGFEVLRRLRKDRVTTPVVILSARGEEWDRVQGLELGADDYVVKPFSMREVLLRVRAQLARAGGGTPGLGEALRTLSFGDVVVDLAGYTLTRAGRTDALSRRELELLAFFVEHAGEVFRRDQLLDRVWGRDSASGPRTVDTHVLKLRKRIEADPEQPKHLVTVRNVGYKFLT
jgi:two-component system alkaline phosphatase synthesis response regulator PhoP